MLLIVSAQGANFPDPSWTQPEEKPDPDLEKAVVAKWEEFRRDHAAFVEWIALLPGVNINEPSKINGYDEMPLHVAIKEGESSSFTVYVDFFTCFLPAAKSLVYN